MTQPGNELVNSEQELDKAVQCTPKTSLITNFDLSGNLTQMFQNCERNFRGWQLCLRASRRISSSADLVTFDR